jgi:hypothetical protein
MDALKQLIEQKKQTTMSLLKKRDDKDKPPEELPDKAKEPVKTPEDSLPSKEHEKTFDLDSYFDLEEIRNEVLKGLPTKKTKYDSGDEKPPVWNYTVTEDEMALLNERNNIFKERFDHQKSFNRKFDFGSDKSYDEKCDDIKFFTIHHVDQYDEHMKSAGKETEKSAVDSYLKELEVFKSMRSDLAYLIQQLSDRVS